MEEGGLIPIVTSISKTVDLEDGQTNGGELKKAPLSKISILTSFHAGYFRISLSLSAQSLLWKTLNKSTAGHLIFPNAAFLLIWSLAFFSLTIVSLFYISRCILRYPSVRLEFSHHIGVNYLFAPFISSLLLLQSASFIRSSSKLYIIPCLLSSVPILVLDIKIYGQWFTARGKRFLSTVANPTSLLTVIGNLVGARAAAMMGWRESAMCMFALGIAHYFVLFVTLYQRLEYSGGGALPAMLRPVFFLFFAAPSMASLAWSSIAGSFDLLCKMLFFLSLFLFASLVSRPALFKRSMKRFNIAWWAYSFPLTLLALAANEYTQEVKGDISNALMLIISIISVLVTLALIFFSAVNPSLLLPRDDPFLPSPLIPPAT
ncbi:uncharacterized protein A4U43_C05F27350 [Asparagus officinalis]|uniref:Uncharacterized protein n=1 Tax=Asparagus officinalis TaxID=4686 RepID=A0A5P1EXE0_ASPOF|nr:S-type anion channel SLAH1-like [Asparagus officinalis]ONK69847.1 uncharacterized protein A4U43_C05F27350 [Asparagus officinalis]